SGRAWGKAAGRVSDAGAPAITGALPQSEGNVGAKPPLNDHLDALRGVCVNVGQMRSSVGAWRSAYGFFFTDSVRRHPCRLGKSTTSLVSHAGGDLGCRR